MGKIFVTGHKVGENAYIADYEPQKTIGCFTPQQLSEWLGPEPRTEKKPVLNEDSMFALGKRFCFPAKKKRKSMVHWV